MIGTDRTPTEQWAHDHDLPYFDDLVHFPDCRIEYRDIDGREDHAAAAVAVLVATMVAWPRAVRMTTSERVQAIADYGLTERQARFLVLVMRHSGLCIKRQYGVFAGVAREGYDVGQSRHDDNRFTGHRAGARRR